MSQEIKSVRFRHTRDWSEGLFRLEKKTVTRGDLKHMRNMIVYDFWAEIDPQGASPQEWELTSLRPIENKKGSFIVIRIEQLFMCGSIKGAS